MIIIIIIIVISHHIATAQLCDHPAALGAPGAGPGRGHTCMCMYIYT